jgi:pimeloyl-ACP methyl ester carboxylesterase
MFEHQPPEFQHTKAKIGDVHLHYGLGGEGPAVILLHGFPETSLCWGKVAPWLSEHYTVLTPDLRGSGFSDKPAGGYDASTMARDVQALAAHVGLKRYFVVGHDMGAHVALCLAALFPENVAGLVYLDEPLPGFNLEQLARFAHDNPNPLWWYPFQTAPDLAELLLAGKEREYVDFFIDQRTHLMDPLAIDNETRATYARHLANAGGVRGAIGWYRAVFETAEQICRIGDAKLSLPVLGINGEFGTPNVGKQMAAVATNTRSAIIKGCGHFVPEERPEELVKEMVSFFSENDF